MREPLTLSSLGVTASHPDRVFALSAESHLTWAQWQTKVQDWAWTLSQLDADRVGLYFDDAVALAAALWGAWHAGKTPCLLADALPASLQRLAAQNLALAGDFPDAIRAEPNQGATQRAPLCADNAQVELFTSGSTGEPVAIRKSLRQLEAEVQALETQFGAEIGPVRVLGTVSAQHIYGLLFRVLWPAAARRPIVAQRLHYPEQITAAFQSAPGVLVTTPAHLKRLPPKLDYAATLPHLQAVFCSGGPLSAAEADHSARLLGQYPCEVYGSTETGGVAWRRQSHGAAWRALPGVEWRIADQQLEVRSAHLQRPDWFRTTDRAAHDGDSFVLCGRADRIVKVEERRVSLNAIERAVLDTELLCDVRVLGLPGRRLLLAVVGVPTAQGQRCLDEHGKSALIARLRNELTRTIDATALPRRWRFVTALPIDTHGKTPEHLLLALFRPLRPEPDWQHRDEQQALLHLSIHPDLRVFSGHFPQQPVLPGVAMLDWAIHFGRQAFVISGCFAGMDAVKFQHVVLPGAHLQLSLSWSAERGMLSFQYRQGEISHASGRIRFHSPPECAP